MTLADLVERMILSALESMEVTSASDNMAGGVKNRLIQVNNIEKPDLNAELTNQTKKENTSLGGKTEAPKTINAKTDFIKKELDPKNIGNVLSSTGGAGGFSGVAGITKLASFAAPIAAPLAIALSIKPITEAIIKELQRPGGFLDKRVKIDARKEAFSMLDRQTRQNTRIGDRQVIIQQFEGFRNFEGHASTNTQELVRESGTRTANIGLFDRAQGVD